METAVPPGKRVLKLNLDETSICLHQQAPRGTLCVSRKVAKGLSRDVPRAHRRCYLSFVAVICDDIEVQRVLPQFLIGNCSTFKRRDVDALQGIVSPNLRLVRQKSAWNDQRLMVEILRDVRACLAPFMGAFQPIFAWDAARQHTTPLVFSAARRCGMWPLTIPSKMTWLLQPLDTHTFATFKRKLSDLDRSPCTECLGGEVGVCALVRRVSFVVDMEILESSWARAFDSNGLGHLQSRVSERVRNALGVVGPIEICAERPSLEQVALCYPKKSSLTQEFVFGNGNVAARVAKPLRRLPPLRTRAFATHGPAEKLGRTRSETLALRATARCAPSWACVAQWPLSVLSQGLNVCWLLEVYAWLMQRLSMPRIGPSEQRGGLDSRRVGSATVCPNIWFVLLLTRNYMWGRKRPQLKLRH